MANPTPAVGDSPVDQKSWPIKWQVSAWILVTVINAVISIIPLLKKDDDKPKDVYTKAEVQQLIDTAVLNSRYAQRADIDDLYTWTLYSFQFNKLEALPPPSSFRIDNSHQGGIPSQPGAPRLHTNPPVLPPRELPHQKKPP